MCTMIAATLISAGVTAAGAYMQSQQQAQQMEMQAREYKRQAFLEREAGAHQAENTQREGKRVQGSQRAGLSASGLDLGTGSALDSQVDSAIEVQRDVNAIRWNSQIKEQNANYKSSESKYNAKMRRKAGIFETITPLINGAAQLKGSFF